MPTAQKVVGPGRRGILSATAPGVKRGPGRSAGATRPETGHPVDVGHGCARHELGVAAGGSL